MFPFNLIHKTLCDLGLHDKFVSTRRQQTLVTLKDGNVAQTYTRWKCEWCSWNDVVVTSG